jgi:hypothetical protein
MVARINITLSDLLSGIKAGFIEGGLEHPQVLVASEPAEVPLRFCQPDSM